MFNKEEFRENALTIIDWIAEYLSTVEKLPVRSKLEYGEIKSRLPETPPQARENIDTIFRDFNSILLDGITHWQSPGFHAYFPANNSPPSILAEFITAALGVQGMKWITSPAATELEEVVMEWLRKMIHLPEGFTGVIQDTASVSTLCAILAAREKITQYTFNEEGTYKGKLTVYCSAEAHSSIEKAVRIAGLGSNSLRKIKVDRLFRMLPEELESAIVHDREKGFLPACIVSALGTTGTCAIDPIQEIGILATKYGIWHHIDAAYAGTALILPEFKKSVPGIELADSFVFNPHKWMFTNFDCSALFVKDSEHLQNTFRLVPSYLQNRSDDHVNDYSNWGIQLGRRFRSLKLWFVIRYYGWQGLQEMVNEHIRLASIFEEGINKSELFELVVPRTLTVVVFRFVPPDQQDQFDLNVLNEKLLENINKTGEIFLSHTLAGDKFVLRFVCSQTYVEQKHVEKAVKVITESASILLNQLQ